MESNLRPSRHERAAIPQSHLMPTVGVFGRLVSRPTAVITLLPGDVATDVLEFHGLRMGQEIDVMVGRDPAMRPKPEPDGVIDACRILGVAPGSATMIGDSTWDAQAALAAGSTFVGVPADGFEEDIRERIATAPRWIWHCRARPQIVYDTWRFPALYTAAGYPSGQWERTEPSACLQWFESTTCHQRDRRHFCMVSIRRC